MPSSQNADELQPKVRPNNRLEFSRATRELLAAAAGDKCAIRGCLTKLKCSAKKDDHEKIVNVGRASHIYAAAPNGPRPAPPSMLAEEIVSYSNGIWTCSSCGDIIDRLDCDYSPNQLHEMKKVRETAEKMAVDDPEIRGLSPNISPFEFDEVFWKHLPDLDPDKIRSALREVVARQYLRQSELDPDKIRSALREIVARQYLRQSELNPDKIRPALLENVVRRDLRQSEPMLGHKSSLYRRAAEIVDAWAKGIQSPDRDRFSYIHEVNIVITARHPHTKAFCESSIRGKARGHSQHEYSIDGGDSLRLEVNFCSDYFFWLLRITFEKGRMAASSALHLDRTLNFLSNSYCLQWRENFLQYEKLIHKLAEGWQPVGFVSMSTNSSSKEDCMYPEAFEIELKTSRPDELDERLYLCKKIRLAFELEMQWKRSFKFTPVYFLRDLDLPTIKSASDNLRARLGLTPYRCRGESPVLISDGRRDIKLLVKDNSLAFEIVLRRS